MHDFLNNFLKIICVRKSGYYTLNGENLFVGIFAAADDARDAFGKSKDISVVPITVAPSYQFRL